MYLAISFTDTATTEIYTLSLHDALPICLRVTDREAHGGEDPRHRVAEQEHQDHPEQERHDVDLRHRDRKSTRLNSSHVKISYAVFCLKKKKKKKKTRSNNTKPNTD